MDVQEGRLAALKHAVERSLVADQRAIYTDASGQIPQLSTAAVVVAEAEAFYRFLCGGSPKSEATHTPQAPKTERGWPKSQAAYADAGEEAGASFADEAAVVSRERKKLLDAVQAHQLSPFATMLMMMLHDELNKGEPWAA